MSLPAQPSKSTATPPRSAKKNTAATTSKSPKATTAKLKREPRSYFAMMVLAIFLLPTGLARAYRGDSSGWTRFWTYVGANLIMIIPVLGQIVGGLALLVLSIIGVFDVFALRKTTTDAHGVTLHASELDKKWAHGIYVYFVVILVLLLLLVFIAALVIGYAIQQYQINGGDFMQQLEPSNSMREPYFEPDSL